MLVRVKHKLVRWWNLCEVLAKDKNGICMGALCHMKIVAISCYVKDHQSLHVSNYHTSCIIFSSSELELYWLFVCYLLIRSILVDENRVYSRYQIFLHSLFNTCWYNLYLLVKMYPRYQVYLLVIQYSVLVDTIFTCRRKESVSSVSTCYYLVFTTCWWKESVSSVSTCYSVFSITSVSAVTQTALDLRESI